MTYDPNDDRRGPADLPREERSAGMAWGGIAVIAILIIGGLVWYNTSQNAGTRTASVPMTTQSAPTSPGTPPATPATPATPKQ